MFPGSYTNYTCIATMSDGFSRTVNATWSIVSAPANRAQINSSTGKLTSNKWSDLTSPVTVTIKASYTEGGATKTATKDVTILVPIDTIIVSGGSSINAGSSQAYSCVAKMADGVTKDVAANWSIDTGSSYGSISSSGILKANATAAGKEIVIKVSYTEGVITCTQKKTISVLQAVSSQNVTVLFESNGGSACDSRQYSIGGTYGSLPAPTKIGWSFGGWYSDSALTSRITSSSTVSSSATTLYAKWTDATVSSISIVGNSVVDSGGNTTYTCKANKSDGTSETVAPTWSVTSGSAYASINSSGKLTASDVSYTKIVMIQAAYDGKTEIKEVAILGSVSTSTGPENDDFSSAKTIAIPSGTTTGDNTGATMETSEPKPTAQASSTGSIWYKWTAPSSGTATFDTIGTGFDTVLGVYTGTSVSSLIEIKSDDDGGGNHTSKLSFEAVSGTTYRIAVYGYNGKTGSITLNWSLSAAQTIVKVSFASNGGSSCGDREYTVGGTYGSLPEPTKSNCSFAGWYSDSSFNTRVYTTTTVSASVTKLYAKWTENRPSNDNFSSPITISGSSGSKSGSNVGATMETSEPKPSVQSSSTGSIWYKWTAPSSGTATFNTIGTGFDTVLGVYAGTSVSSLTEIKSDDDGGGSDRTSKLSFEAVSGTTYRIAVYGYSGKTGSITLNWSMSAAPATVKVSFASNGGSSCGDQEYAVGGTYGSLPEPTRSGQKFLGWFTLASGGVRVTAETVVEQGITLYAHWVAAWTVKFNANGGTVAESSRMVQKGKAVGTLPKPTRSGYTFKGWYTKKSGGSKVSTKTKVKKNVTYYARWTAKKYAVTLKKTGKGTVSGGGKKAYKSKITLKAKASKGYVFRGWYDANGNLVSSKATWKTKVPLGGATYTAKFEKKTAAKSVTVTSRSTGGAVPRTSKGATVGTPSLRKGTLADGNGTFTLIVDGNGSFLAVESNGGRIATECEILCEGDGEIVVVTADGAVFRLAVE